MTDKKTTIAISMDTKDRLDSLGGKGDTYDGIILILLDQVTGKKKRKEFVPKSPPLASIFDQARKYREKPIFQHQT